MFSRPVLGRVPGAVSIDFRGDLELYFETLLRQLFEQADFVKIVLPPTREPQSGGSGDLEQVAFFHDCLGCRLGTALFLHFSTCFDNFGTIFWTNLGDNFD